MSVPILHGGSSKFRQGVLQLMINSVDPLHDEIAMRRQVQQAQTAHKLRQPSMQSHAQPPAAIITCPHMAPSAGESTICILCLEQQQQRIAAPDTGSNAHATPNSGFGSTATNLGSQVMKSSNGTSGVWAINGGVPEMMSHKRSSLASIQENQPASHPVYPLEAKVTPISIRTSSITLKSIEI